MAGRHLGPVRQHQRRSASPISPRSGSDRDAWRDGVEHVRDDVVRAVGRHTRPSAIGLRAGRSIDDLYQQFGADRFGKLVEKVTGRRPAASTIRRWRRTDRIPNSHVVQRLQREALIDRMGGTRQAAAQAGVSPSTIRRYVTGKTQKLRSTQARDELISAHHTQAAHDASIDNHGNPLITIDGDFSVVSSTTDYPIGSRTITMGPHNGTAMGEQSIEDLFDAYINGDEQRLTAIIESTLTIDYFGSNYDGFTTYSPANRVRIDDIRHLNIEWPELT